MGPWATLGSMSDLVLAKGTQWILQLSAFRRETLPVYCVYTHGWMGSVIGEIALDLICNYHVTLLSKLIKVLYGL